MFPHDTLDLGAALPYQPVAWEGRTRSIRAAQSRQGCIVCRGQALRACPRHTIHPANAAGVSCGQEPEAAVTSTARRRISMRATSGRAQLTTMIAAMMKSGVT